MRRELVREAPPHKIAEERGLFRAAEVAALSLDLRGLVELHRAVVIPGVALARRLGVGAGRGPRPDVLRAMLLRRLRVLRVVIDRERLDQQRDGAAPRVDEARVGEERLELGAAALRKGEVAELVCAAVREATTPTISDVIGG